MSLQAILTAVREHGHIGTSEAMDILTALIPKTKPESAASNALMDALDKLEEHVAELCAEDPEPDESWRIKQDRALGDTPWL